MGNFNYFTNPRDRSQLCQTDRILISNNRAFFRLSERQIRTLKTILDIPTNIRMSEIDIHQQNSDILTFVSV